MQTKLGEVTACHWDPHHLDCVALADDRGQLCCINMASGERKLFQLLQEDRKQSLVFCTLTTSTEQPVGIASFQFLPGSPFELVVLPLAADTVYRGSIDSKVCTAGACPIAPSDTQHNTEACFDFRGCCAFWPTKGLQGVVNSVETRQLVFHFETRLLCLTCRTMAT